MKSKTKRKLFSKTPGCKSGVHCATCRKLDKGRAWRENIQQHYELPDDDTVDFKCPLGKPWGFIPTEPPKMTAVKKVKNAAKASCRAAKAVVRRQKVVVSDEEQRRRLDICHKCDYFKPENGTCKLCGCYANLKVRLETEHCPDKPPRW